MTKNYLFQVFIAKQIELTEFGAVRSRNKKYQVHSSCFCQKYRTGPVVFGMKHCVEFYEGIWRSLPRCIL